MKEISDFEFDEVIKQGMVLVFFSAAWCAPCKDMAKLLANVKTASVVKIDVGKNPKVSVQLGISMLPSFFLYKSGRLVNKHCGTLTKKSLDAFLSLAV